MAEPNPDDGLVPEISELYKRNPAEWQREAKKRTKLEATMEKMEEVESSLDGETNNKNENNNNDGKQKKFAVSKNENNATSESNEKSKMTSTETRSSAEAQNIENRRDSKRSKLSSRR
eukprot:395836_1